MAGLPLPGGGRLPMPGGGGLPVPGGRLPVPPTSSGSGGGLPLPQPTSGGYNPIQAPSGFQLPQPGGMGLPPGANSGPRAGGLPLPAQNAQLQSPVPASPALTQGASSPVAIQQQALFGTPTKSPVLPCPAALC